jgi:hypothetical protein
VRLASYWSSDNLSTSYLTVLPALGRKKPAHVLDVPLASRDAADSREVVKVASSVTKPTPLAEDWDSAAATF